MDIATRATDAIAICKSAGALGVEYFRDPSALQIDTKGPQDWVSDADKNVELHVRNALAKAWPNDGIVGEEHAPTPGTSGFKWVIDPIDGTTNFVNAIPAWTVVLAGVMDGRTEIGVIHDPVHGETFAATRGGGAFLNGAPMRVAETALSDGSIGVGYSNRVDAKGVVTAITDVVASGALFHRNASGALSLAYVASGRLLGFIEEHMNAWDCLAGQLLVAEAGGRVEDQNADAMIADGGRVVAGSTVVFDELLAIATRAWPNSV